MRTLIYFLSLILTVTLVSRSFAFGSQYFTAGTSEHTHENSSEEHDWSLLTGSLTHDHEHDHQPDISSHDDPASPISSGSHGHSHTHILVDNSPWIKAEPTPTIISIERTIVSWSPSNESYVFNFLSSIFRPPIA